MRTALVAALSATCIVGVGCAASWVSGRSWVSARGRGPERVLLIVIDTVRADHLSSYGHVRPTTPRIDALAEDGLLFEQAYSAASWTLPAFGSILTGLYPHEHGAGRNPPGSTRRFGWLRPDVSTLPGQFHTQGYRTAAFVNNPFLAPEFGLHRFFDHYDFEAAGNEEHRSARETVDAAMGWLTEEATPAFALIHFMEPHLRYDPPAHTRWTFRDRDEKPGFPLPFTADALAYRSREKTLTPSQIDYVERAYDEEILAADHAVGRLVDRLETLGMLDDTLLIITSDHGEEFWDHGSFEHGHTLYGELTRIPLVMYGPRLRAQRVRTPVQHTDLFVGLLNWIGAELPSGCRGEDIFELASRERAGAPEDRPILTEGQLYGGPRVAITEGRDRLVLRLRSQKLRLWRTDEFGAADVVAPRPERALVGRLLERLVELRGGTRERDPVEGDPHLTEGELERLRALGYIE